MYLPCKEYEYVKFSQLKKKTFRLDRIVYCLRDIEQKSIEHQDSLKIKEWGNYWLNTGQK